MDVCLVFRVELSHPKVCYLWDPPVIKKYVAGLDITVDDAAMRVFMQVQEPARYPNNHIIPPLPIKLAPFISICICKPFINLSSHLASIYCVRALMNIEMGQIMGKSRSCPI